MIGRSLAQYRILAKIGEGGMGQVWRAHDSKLGRDVAIKVLPEQMAADREFLGRFEREARLLAGMNHPNIAAIHGLEDVEGLHFLVMELVEGENLAQLLLKGPVDLAETLSIAQQIAEALDFAHLHGVVHRDLKPANVAITEDGKIKLLDFGLAKALERDAADSVSDLAHSPTELLSAPTAAGVILGTAAYMSPEQARGKKVDKRTDIFAFGALVYELLTGRVLFGGETVSDILAAVLRAEPDFGELPEQTPRALRNLLDRSLQKNPRRRLRDIGEACILLEDIQSGKVVDSPAPEDLRAANEMDGPPRTGRALQVAGWIVATLLLVTLVLTWSMRVTAPQTQDRSVIRQVIPLSHLDPSATHQFDPQISHDGKRIAFVSQNKLWLRDLSETDTRSIAGTAGATCPFFSHDDASIGFAIADKLYRSRLDKNDKDLIATMDGSTRLGANASAVWQSDNTIYMATNSSGILSVSSRGGTISEWLSPGEGELDFHDIGMLPDNKGYLTVPHNSEGYGNIDIVRPDRSRSRILELPEAASSPVYSPSGHILFVRGGGSGGIWAFDFSLERMERTSEPFLVALGGDRPSVSANGTLCYVDGSVLAEAQLTWYSRSGAVLGTLGEPVQTTRPFPRISPDGTQAVCAVLFGDTDELYLFDVASGNQRRLTFDERNEETAAWVDNSSLVYYENNTYNLYSLNMSSETTLIARGILPSVTPDKSQIIISQLLKNADWDWDLVAVSMDGTQEQVLVEGPGVQWFGVVSPNGRYLAYQSDETGTFEVFVTTFPVATTRWQVSTKGGQQPRWSKDGTEIVFTTRRTMWSTAVQTDGSFRFELPEQLFERSSTDWSAAWTDGFDITADGQRFLLWDPIPVPEGQDPRLVIVHNWFEEFRQD